MLAAPIDSETAPERWMNGNKNQASILRSDKVQIQGITSGSVATRPCKEGKAGAPGAVPRFAAQS